MEIGDRFRYGNLTFQIRRKESGGSIGLTTNDGPLTFWLSEADLRDAVINHQVAYLHADHLFFIARFLGDTAYVWAEAAWRYSDAPNAAAFGSQIEAEATMKALELKQKHSGMRIITGEELNCLKVMRVMEQ